MRFQMRLTAIANCFTCNSFCRTATGGQHNRCSGSVAFTPDAVDSGDVDRPLLSFGQWYQGGGCRRVVCYPDDSAGILGGRANAVKHAPVNTLLNNRFASGRNCRTRIPPEQNCRIRRGDDRSPTDTTRQLKHDVYVRIVPARSCHSDRSCRRRIDYWLAFIDFRMWRCRSRSVTG